MHQGHELGWLLPEDLLHLFHAEYISPGPFQAAHLRAVAAGHIAGALAKVAVHPDENRIARFDRVAQGRLHPGAAGTGHRNCQLVLRLKYVRSSS